MSDFCLKKRILSTKIAQKFLSSKIIMVTWRGPTPTETKTAYWMSGIERKPLKFI
jgi:hypothetical protein